jgi:predicted glutamine amidotransferase
LFAHNGVVEGLDELDARLADLGASGLVQGATDSERVFALITAETAVGTGDLTAGLVAAIGWISEDLPVYSINVVLTTRCAFPQVTLRSRRCRRGSGIPDTSTAHRLCI